MSSPSNDLSKDISPEPEPEPEPEPTLTTKLHLQLQLQLHDQVNHHTMTITSTDTQTSTQTSTETSATPSSSPPPLVFPLPLAIWSYIFSFLDARYIITTCSHMCDTWKDAITSPITWSHVTWTIVADETWTVSRIKTELMSLYHTITPYGHIKHLTLINTWMEADDFHTILTPISSHLTHLILTHPSHSFYASEKCPSPSLHGLSTCTRLTSLQLSHAYLTPINMMEISMIHTTLQHLNITCHVKWLNSLTYLAQLTQLLTLDVTCYVPARPSPRPSPSCANALIDALLTPDTRLTSLSLAVEGPAVYQYNRLYSSQCLHRIIHHPYCITSLTSLSLFRSGSWQQLDDIHDIDLMKFTSLRHVTVNQDTIRWITNPSSHFSITTLTLSHLQLAASELRTLSHTCCQLTHLTFVGCSDIDLSMLTRINAFTKLEELTLYETDVNDDALLGAWNTHDSIPITLRNIHLIENTRLTRAGVAALKRTFFVALPYIRIHVSPTPVVA